jgi:TetR/AcrR family transcriptional regulator, mexCD-oprJ operon repressor
VAAVILDAAAHVFANGGESSMNEIAETAGVGRATLYRYFPNRQALWDEVAVDAVSKVGERLQQARLDGVAIEEGLRRAIRALVEVGDYFVVITRARADPSSPRLDTAISVPLDQLFDRGQSTGFIRTDLDSAWLTDALVSQVVTALSAPPTLGREDVVSAIASFFLDGARARE